MLHAFNFQYLEDRGRWHKHTYMHTHYRSYFFLFHVKLITYPFPPSNFYLSYKLRIGSFEARDVAQLVRVLI